MKKVIALLAVLAVVALAGQAQASLSLRYQFVGNGNWSLDAVGSNRTPVGTISAVVPEGSTVVKAYLYSSNIYANYTVPTVNFNGTVYSGAQFTSLGTVNTLTAYRADVTSQVSALIGSGSASPFNFTVNAETPNTGIDGEVLAIIYSNPAEALRTIAFLDGFSSQTGDSFTFNFGAPVDPTQPGFETLMSLGIGYSYQQFGGNQYSIVDVNGRRLTTAAGGEDDGTPENGGLITVGGIGDSPANPANPFATPTNPRSDDELYDLTSFLSVGDTSFTVHTANPSLNDNIFFTGINVTAEGNVNVVPLPPALLILGSGLLRLALKSRRQS